MSHLLALLLLTIPPALTAEPAPWSIQVLSPEMKTKMEGVSWRPGCPVGRDRLRLVHVLHVDFQGRERKGELIVHEKIAPEVVTIFQELRRLRFPMDQVVAIEAFAGNDENAMENNATSAFNCREVAGKPGVYSKHSYGIGIDINPVLNPYKSPTGWSPPNSLEYVTRTPVRPGMIVPGSAALKAFESRGWTWGGRWKNEIDYQHFDKRGFKP